MPLLILAQALGLPLVGWLRDRTGTYLPAIALIECLTLGAVLCIARLRLPARGWTQAAGGDCSV